jgi:hypothetical protein
VPARDRIGLPTSVDQLIGRHVDAVMEELHYRYSKALAHNPAGGAVMAKVVRRATVSGLLAQLDLDGRFVGHLPGAGATTWDDWQRQRRQTLEGSEWPAHLAAAMPAITDEAGASVAAAGAEVGLRERRLGDVRRVGEQAAEAGAALVRCLTAEGG